MTQTTHPGTTRAGNPDLASAINGGIFLRAVLAALVIGSVLTLANQSTAIFGAEAFKIPPLVLAYLTPFAVVAISQMLGIRRAMMDALQNDGHRWGGEPVLATAFAHGIPLRVVLVGILAGSANAAIVVTIALLEGAGLNSLPVAVLVQAYTLPILFGLLSQTIAYRRAILKYSQSPPARCHQRG